MPPGSPAPGAHAGDDFLFVVDANQGYTVAEALDFLAAVRAEGIAIRWFEEPTRWHADFRGLRDVRLRGNVDVAAGQSEISRVGMREMMAAGAIDVCNYDASWGGGPTEWRRIAALAAAFDVQLGHHEEGQIAAHLLASQPHGTYVEAFSPARDPIFWGMIENRPALIDGAVAPARLDRASAGSSTRPSSSATASIAEAGVSSRGVASQAVVPDAAAVAGGATDPCRSRRVIARARVSTSTKLATSSGSESRPSDTTNARSAASKTSGTSVQ